MPTLTLLQFLSPWPLQALRWDDHLLTNTLQQLSPSNSHSNRISSTLFYLNSFWRSKFFLGKYLFSSKSYHGIFLNPSSISFLPILSICAASAHMNLPSKKPQSLSLSREVFTKFNLMMLISSAPTINKGKQTPLHKDSEHKLHLFTDYRSTEYRVWKKQHK